MMRKRGARLTLGPVKTEWVAKKYTVLKLLLTWVQHFQDKNPQLLEL